MKIIYLKLLEDSHQFYHFQLTTLLFLHFYFQLQYVMLPFEKIN